MSPRHPKNFAELPVNRPKNRYTNILPCELLVSFPDDSTPVGEQSIAISLSVCLCVWLSVREHISWTAGPIVTDFFVHIPCGHGSVLLWQRCDTLCTSCCMDDVAFGRSGPYVDAWRASGVAIPRRSLWYLWMPCFVLPQSAVVDTYTRVYCAVYTDVTVLISIAFHSIVWASLGSCRTGLLCLLVLVLLDSVLLYAVSATVV